MQPIARPRRPALPLALGLFAGIAARGAVELTWLKLLPWFAAGLALIHCARPRPLLPRVLIPLVAALLGARAFQDCRDASLRSTGDWLPGDGSAVQLELTGEVATAPSEGSTTNDASCCARGPQPNGRERPARASW